QPLHGAILAEGAMQHRKDHVDFRLRLRLGQDGPRRPLTVPTDKVFRNLVLIPIQASRHGTRGAHRDLMFPTAPAVDDRYPQLHRMRFPIPDMINSTARSAVRLTSSITGFTSTTSIETIFPESQIISSAKCA